jgi:hypothetical protein
MIGQIFWEMLGSERFDAYLLMKHNGSICCCTSNMAYILELFVENFGRFEAASSSQSPSNSLVDEAPKNPPPQLTHIDATESLMDSAKG